MTLTSTRGSSSGSVVLDEAGAERDDDHLSSVPHVELGHGVAGVRLDGVRGDVELTGFLQTVEDAARAMTGVPIAVCGLLRLCDVELGYSRLGQPAPETSDGVAAQQTCHRAAADLPRASVALARRATIRLQPAY